MGGYRVEVFGRQASYGANSFFGWRWDLGLRDCFGKGHILKDGDEQSICLREMFRCQR